MSNKIDVDSLSKEIDKYLTDYAEDISEEVETTTKGIMKEAKQELIVKSPRSGLARNTKYYKGWAIKTGARTRNKNYKYTEVIWNKTNYQLTHLLEFGHTKRDGTGWVDAQPHIRDVEQKYGKKFADLLEQRIRRIK